MNAAAANNLRFCELMESATSIGGRQSVNDTVLTDAAYQEARALIEQGLDYTPSDSPRHSVFGNLITKVEDHTQAAGLLELMVERGGNPLLVAKGEMRDLLNKVTQVRLLDPLLAKLEKEGRGLRDREGGNLYHTIARHHCWHLGERADSLLSFVNLMGGVKRLSTEKRTYQPGGEPIELPGQIAWLNQVDQHGDTPLHVLWAADTFDRTLEDNDSDDTNAVREYLLDLNGYSADTTLSMMMLGADILVPNLKGERAWDLMRMRDFNGIQGSYAVSCEQIHAMAENTLLERGTAAAPVRTSGALRL